MNQWMSEWFFILRARYGDVWSLLIFSWSHGRCFWDHRLVNWAKSPPEETQAEWMRDQDFSQEFNSSLEQQQCTSNPKGSNILSVDSACSPHAWHPVDTQKIFDELIRNGKVRIKSREQIFIECSLCYNHCLPGMAFNSQKHLDDWLSARASIEHRSILETQDSPSLVQGYSGSDWG